MNHETPAHTEARMRRARWLVLPVAFALTLLFYRHIALSNRILSGVDAFTYFFPYRDYAARAIQSAHIPLWNPYLFLGAPFLANPQSAVFYPLNLVLASMSGPKIVAWSIVLHVTLAALSSYAYARRIGRLSAPAAFLAASAFAYGGFLSGQTGHVNQLNVSAWFPLLLLVWEESRRPGRSTRRWTWLLVLGALIGLSLLAGHTQSTFISLFGLGLYALVSTARRSQRVPSGQTMLVRTRDLGRRLWSAVWPLILACTVGLFLAAVQLLPTAELAPQSIRSGGLSYREVVAFSLKPEPRLLWHSFFPPWGRNLADVFGGDFYTEYLAYIGVIALLLAGLAALTVAAQIIRTWRKAPDVGRLDGFSLRVSALGAAGLTLALGLYNPLYWVLYRVVPGFGLFRVPARWLLLYAFGAAMLAGTGLDQLQAWLARHAGRGASRGIGLLLTVAAAIELLIAAQDLPFAQPTAPEAFSSLRTAPAHILAAQQGQAAPGRFLSMSDIAFDPGDMAEMEQMFGGVLTPQALYDYVVCAKRQEIIAPNLPLAWRLYAVDGYDGGVLPLSRYVSLQRLFLPEDQILIDGRLREGLKHVPSSRLLSILGVQWVITDKVHDVWIDDVFYDLAFAARLDGGQDRSVSVQAQPRFTATAVGIVSHLEGADRVANDMPLAEVRIEGEGGSVQTVVLRAGRDTSEGDGALSAVHDQARVGRVWSPPLEGQDYVTRLGWDAPLQVSGISIRTLPFDGQLVIQGVALIDERDGSNVPIVLSSEGQFRQVHSGDVKVYEVLDALPRAYVVHHARVVTGTASTLAALADAGLNPAREVVLAHGQQLDQDPPTPPEVQVIAYAPEEVTIRAQVSAPGYLVLNDSWYPGWKAAVDGTPADIERANLAFRAVYLPSGEHTVQFHYQPASYAIGLGISAATLVAILIALARWAWPSWRDRRS